ncbi:hypothetical protein G7068_14895 [Leucobacter viscericola]|uniref:Uncharacterized protein n=1 Tax=Leucobacter viscericola TaxID=2714935 RepID=A0A6G7XIZ8_9MICO|nr:hypothetical protein [Leucobacter viscericola]QIK64347.1 hypothetical protein G7068_14895 [Leucobacter viscericola]
MKKVTVKASLILLSSCAIFVSVPQAANASPLNPVTFTADSAPVAPLPDTLTNDEMNELVSGMQDDTEGQVSLAGPHTFVAKTNPLCMQDTGEIWLRTSGSGYQFGAIGGKPSLSCNVPVEYLAFSTDIYRQEIWGWQKVAGPFTNQNWGAASLTQKSVEYICTAGQPYTNFRMIANGTVTYPGGTPISGGAYSDTKNPGLPCH